MENITIKNSKNLDLSISICESVLKSEKLAIICPGYLDSMEYPHITSLQTDLANSGYTAVSFDPTGTWSSGGVIGDFNMSQYIEDIHSIKSYMKTKMTCSEILLVGHSMGAYSSLYYSSIYSDVSSVVAIMPPVSMSKKTEKNNLWKQTGVRKSVRIHPVTEEEIIFNVPYSTFENSEEYILVDNISSIRIPKLFISGSKDIITPLQGVQELYSLSQEPKKYIELQEVDHNYYKKPEHVSKLNSEIISWNNNQKKPAVIVDTEDNVLGFKKREDIVDDIYRVSALWITDKDGNILLAQRALTKKHHPGLFGPAVTGTVEQGETYEYNIQKEVEEELGLRDLDIKEVKTEFHNGTYKHFTRWYRAEIDKDTVISLQEDEVAGVRWFDPQELKALLEDQPEVFLESLKKHFEYFEELKN